MQIEYLERSPVVYNASAIKVLHFSVKNGESFRPHWHERIEIIYLKKGCGEFLCGTKKGILNAGSVLIVPPRFVHSMKALSDTEYDTLMFDIRFFYNDTDVCKRILPGFLRTETNYENVCSVPDIVESIRRICNEVNPDALEAVSEMYHLLHLFIENKVVVLSGKEDADGVYAIAEYLEKHFAERITVSDLCRCFGYTSAHLCRKFKKATGLPPMTYLKIYRLECAFSMHCAQKLSVSEVAMRCGFDDANYFTRCFKSHFGHPPSFYTRKKNEEKE